MAKNSECRPDESGRCCCEVEAVVTVDERGQMVLPKALRTRMGVEPGDKLAAVVMERGEDVCCVTLMKMDDLSPMVRDFLGPIVSEVLGEQSEE